MTYYPWEQTGNDKLKRTLRITGKILEWTVSLLLLVVFFTVLSPRLPTKNKIQTYVISTGSMEPTVHAGSIAIIQPYKHEILKKGEIIAFTSPANPQQTILHRIHTIKKKNNQTIYTTKGDNNNAADNWEVPTASIRGIYRASVPFLGHPAVMMHTKLGFALYMGIPAFLIILMQLKTIRDGINEEVTKRTKKITSAVLIFLLSANFFVLWGGFHAIQAAFSSSATVSGLSISVADFLPPPVPELLAPPDATSAASLISLEFSWSEVIDEQGSNPVTYEFESCDVDPALNGNICSVIREQDTVTTPFKNGTGYIEGPVWWRVRAIDSSANESDWTPSRKLTIDNSTPTVELSVTGSFTKSVEEKIQNGSFEDDLLGWTEAGDVTTLSSDLITNAPSGSLTVTPHEGTTMVRIGKKSGSGGKQVWENRLMKSIEAGAKSLSFYFNFFTRDFLGFDEPGFFVRLNGREAMRLDTTSVNPTGETDGKARNSGWQQANLDLSDQNGEQINLVLYAGNTLNTNYQSWVYLDTITTYFVAAPSHAVYTLAGSDTGSGIERFEYNIDATGWFIGQHFQIPDNGSHTLQYRSVDTAGNMSTIHTVKIITDAQEPSAITDLALLEIATNSATLAWTAPGNDGNAGKAALYEMRYSADPITASNFDGATLVENIPVPKFAGEEETLQIVGLNPETVYYFAIKTKDEAPNSSALSNVITATTVNGDLINPGDIVINEIMWMGTSASSSDEWLELRNMTNRTINLDGFSLTKFNGTLESDMILSSFSGKSIPPNGYFLISNGNSYTGGKDSQLNVTPDISDSALDLSNTTLEIKLYDANENVIDRAWDGSSPKEGLLITSTPKSFYSMERTTVPGDGSDPLNWYTCIDDASTADFFDNDADERGTPKAVNRSENEPYSREAKIASALPQLDVVYEKNSHAVSFEVSNVSNYENLSYTITYESDEGMQGVVGKADLKGFYSFVKDDIALGTCSSEGVCVYHTNTHNLSVEVELTTKDGMTKKINFEPV